MNGMIPDRNTNLHQEMMNTGEDNYMVKCERFLKI